ncbi:MAG: hypothetical protein MJ237_08600 [bacterium]|nr:hypothetical protein [bacterium]
MISEHLQPLDKICIKCEKLGITYAEYQRREWLKEEKKRKEDERRLKSNEVTNKRVESIK